MEINQLSSLISEVHITVFPGFAAFSPPTDLSVPLNSEPSRLGPQVFGPAHVSM